MDKYADEVGEWLRHLGLRRPILVGHSMGGQVVISVAARHPELGGRHRQPGLAPATSPDGTGDITDRSTI